MKKMHCIGIALLAFFTVAIMGCSEAHRIEDITESELLEAHGIVATIPENRYFYFFESDDLRAETALHVLGRSGQYYFSPGDWTDELILQLVQASEDGIRFTRDWLEYDADEPIVFIFNITRPPVDAEFHFWGGGAVFGNTVYISVPSFTMPSLIVHEAVHAILRFQERQSNFPLSPETSSWHSAQFFEEGLCNVVDFLFFMETEHRYDVNRYGTSRTVQKNHLHNEAVRMLRFYNKFEDESEFGTRYAQLMSYETAASFIYFLLNYKGTAADFAEVFEDIYLMEEIYGADMETLIDEWLVYLEQFRTRRAMFSANLIMFRSSISMLNMFPFFNVGSILLILSYLWLVIVAGFWIYANAKIRSKIPKTWVAIVILSPLIGLVAYRIIVRKMPERSSGKHKKHLIASIACHIASTVLFIGIMWQIIVQMM